MTTQPDHSTHGGDTEPGDTEPGDTEPGDTEPVDSDGDEPEVCGLADEVRACETEKGVAGSQYCWRAGADESRTWGPCLTEIECELGDIMSCGIDPGESGGEEFHDECVLHGGEPQWTCSFDDDCECNTPLVLSFDGAEPAMGAAASAAFDLDVAGGCLSTDWPAAHTPWLALDRDGDGAIADGRELFGSGTRLASGKRAAHGFAALAELDDNVDGVIDVNDAGFAKLVLWGDRDLDKRGTALELEPMAGRVLALELGYASERRCDDRGNCGIERASFTWIDADGSLRTGEIVDLHLACQ